MLVTSIAAGVETKPVPVLRVIDGNTIEVGANLGGVQHPVRVRLLYVDTPAATEGENGEVMPEGKAAEAFLREQIPIGTRLILESPGESFELDESGRVLALVKLWAPDFSTPYNWAIVYAGWSPYWRGHGDAPAEVEEIMQLAEHEARRLKAGAWATAPQWMQDKANERRAPKEKKP